MQAAIQARSPRWLFLVGTVAILAMLFTGCGRSGQDSVETDPGATDELPVENLPDPDFDSSGSGLDQDGVDSGDASMGAAVELSDVFFDFDKFDLDGEDRDALAQNSRLLREHADIRVMVEGHCDERGTVQYNLALGEKRAKQVRDYLVSLGVDVGRIDVVTYGKERPFSMDSGEVAWSQNRRAHFVVQ